MATGVGLRIAEDECLAAIVVGGEPGVPAPEPIFVVRESVLHMSDDGDTELGGDSPAGHSHSIAGFVSAVGDPAGISVDDGEAYRAEDLVATALFCLIDLAAAHLSGPAEFYAVHPANWPAAQVLALRDALDYLGLRSVVLVSEVILPDANTGREKAAAAARGALAAVLSTPAGATPPDPSHAENPLEATDVLPAIPTSEPPAQAYSAAIPARAPVTAESESAKPPKPPATTVAPPVVVTAAPRARRTPLLIAAAAAIGLLLGGIAVAMLLRGSTAAPAPAVPDARSSFASTPPPTTTPVIRPAPITIVPEQVPVRRTPPPQKTTPPPPPADITAPPPPTSTTAPTGTTTPTSTPTTTSEQPYPTTSASQSPYFPYTFDPFSPNTFIPFDPNPAFPMQPGAGLPSVGSP